MACNASKTPLLRHLAARGFSAAAQPQQGVAAKASGIKTTTLPTKLVVASTESNSPIARIAVVFRAGSRNETPESLGACHHLRMATGLSTKNASSFAITRHLQEKGASLTCTTDRELIAYNVDVTKNHLETALKYLESAVTGQVFKPWEIGDNAYHLQEDIKRMPDCIKAIELLHEASFAGGLGNSIYCPKHQIGKLSSETLQHYFANNCSASRCAVVGVGVDHRMLVGYAQSLGLDTAVGSENASAWVGPSEIRWDKGGNMASVAVGTQGASLKNVKEALTHSILQYAAGVGPVTKRGGDNGALTKQLSAGCTAGKTLNAMYSDTGLFGFIVSGKSSDVGKAVEAGIKALKSGSISDDDVNRGKEALKAAVIMELDTDSGLFDALAQQAGTTGEVQDVAAIISAIDGISASDVKSAARKIASQKMSIGAVGNLAHVPRLNQLN